MDLPKPETSILKSQAFQISALIHPGVQTSFNFINRRLTCSGSHAAYFCKCKYPLQCSHLGHTTSCVCQSSFSSLFFWLWNVMSKTWSVWTRKWRRFPRPIFFLKGTVFLEYKFLLKCLGYYRHCISMWTMPFPLVNGSAPGDHSIIWSLISFIAFKISNMFGTFFFLWFFEWWL